MSDRFSRNIYPSAEVKRDELVEILERSPERKFKCQACSKHFSSKHCLREHGFSHTGERPYSCRVCQKFFKHASQLSLHKKIYIVSRDLQWVRLTDLLSNYKISIVEVELKKELAELPLISEPQEFRLPKISSWL